jgi:chromosome segregation ATPase
MTQLNETEQQLAEANRRIEYLELCDSEATQQLAAKDAEIARLKTVPMKYRRMAFNAQLQDENEQLCQQLAAKDAEIARLRAAFTKWASSEDDYKNDVELCQAFQEGKGK